MIELNKSERKLIQTLPILLARKKPVMVASVLYVVMVSVIGAILWPISELEFQSSFLLIVCGFTLGAMIGVFSQFRFVHLLYRFAQTYTDLVDDVDLQGLSQKQTKWTLLAALIGGLLAGIKLLFYISP